jgi:hypothetical protein
LGNAVWTDFLAGFPKALPDLDAEGLDQSGGWGATYWGGALFCLTADVEIREKTDNRKSLDDALRAILAAGGDIRVDWELERVLDVGDAATGTTVLRDLYARTARSPWKPDLGALWKRLGIVGGGRELRFDDAAPLAALRRSMTQGSGSVHTRAASCPVDCPHPH